MSRAKFVLALCFLLTVALMIIRVEPLSPQEEVYRVFVQALHESNEVEIGVIGPDGLGASGETAVFRIMLSHRLATDHLTIAGIDWLESSLNLLALLVANDVITLKEARKVLQDSRPDEYIVYRDPPLDK